MDMAKYRNLFVEEATENLAELSRALLALEKTPDCGESIDLAFRMAHSIKGMAGSLEYDSIAELAHSLEDRMDAARSAGRLEGRENLDTLFRGLDELERMVAAVRDTGKPPPRETGEAGPAPPRDAEAAPEAEAGSAADAAPATATTEGEPPKKARGRRTGPPKPPGCPPRRPRSASAPKPSTGS